MQAREARKPARLPPGVRALGLHPPRMHERRPPDRESERERRTERKEES